MATPNKLEVTLSFKPLMDGLNRFVAGYQARMAQVQAFNQRIQNGEAALQRALGQVGAVLGGAALLKYSRDAREADKVQAQLVRTLKQTGETGALEALNAQAAALQRVTEFGDESVTTVQRLLISFGLTAVQAQGLTESVLDFASATGQSAESAAMLMGRTLAGDSDELGRYKIQLDTTKGKVDALRDALSRYSGQARAAVPDAAGRDVAARYAEATEQLGRASNAAAVPFFQALIPLLERFAAWATANTANIAAVATSLGDMAAAAAPLVLAIGILKGAMTGWLMVVNPLRAAIVLLSGRSLLELSNAIAKSTGGVAGFWATLKNGGSVLTGLGSAISAVGGVVAAFFAGWELGKIINDMQYSGLKVKDWAALWVVALLDTIGGAFTWFQIAWVNTKFTIQEGLNELLLFIRDKQLMVQEGLNKILPGSAQKYNTSGLRQEVAELQQHIGNLEAARVAAVAAINGDRSARSGASRDLMLFMQPDAALADSGGKGGTAGPRPDLNGGNFGDTDATKKAAAELALKRELYALDTKIIQARAAGDQKLEQSYQLERDYLQAINDLGQDQGRMIDARQAAETLLAEKERERQTQEQKFSRDIADLEAELTRIDRDKFKTQQEKDAARIKKLGEINTKIDDRIRLLEREQALNPDPTRQGQIDDLRGKKNANKAEQDSAAPLTAGQGVDAGMVDILTRAADLFGQMRASINSIAQSLTGTVSTALMGLITRTMAWGQALRSIAGGLMQSIIQAIIDMAAQWIVTHLIMKTVSIGFHALLSALGWERVAESNSQEAAKTPALMTNAAAANAGSFGMAAVVGIAVLLAMMASFATGGLVSGPGTGTSDSIPARLSNGEFVATAAAVDHFGPAFFAGLNRGALDLASLPASIASQIPAAMAGASGPVSAGQSAAEPVASGGGRGNVYNAFFSDRPSAKQWLESKDGQKNLIRMRGDLGLET